MANSNCWKSRTRVARVAEGIDCLQLPDILSRVVHARPNRAKIDGSTARRQEPRERIQCF